MRRTVGHYLLLTLAIVFFGEEFLFLANALASFGREAAIGKRFLVLTIGVFLTALAALYGFLRTIRFPAGAVVALLLLQPAIGAVANSVARVPQKNFAIANGCAAVAAAFVGVVIRRNTHSA